MKNTQSKIKPMKIEKQPGTTYCFGCKDFTFNFRPQKVKITKQSTQRNISLCFLLIK